MTPREARSTERGPTPSCSSASATGSTTHSAATGTSASRSRSTTPDWTKLSVSGRQTLRLIAWRVALGYSVSEIATELGLPVLRIEHRLAELRCELEQQGIERSAEEREADAETQRFSSLGWLPASSGAREQLTPQELQIARLVAEGKT